MSVPAFALGLDTEPMEARLVDALPVDAGWQFEPKWDGFRCLAFRAGNHVELRAKSGKSLSRYFPDMLANLLTLRSDNFVLDGELAIPVGDTLSFDALQMRLHPAESRVRKLASEMPAKYILFDCLATAAGSLIGAPLDRRRTALEALHEAEPDAGFLRLSPFTRDRRAAQRWLDRAHGALDGVIAKRVAGSYEAGERAMLKVKHLRTADCVVGGFRYGKDTRLVGSLLLGLYDKSGKLDHVGYTSAFSDAERPALTERLLRLVAPPGFTGDAPGGPSRWSTERSAEWRPLRPDLVAEVRYDHVTGGRFRHGTMFMRWRPDKAPAQCTRDQLREEARPAKLIAEVL